jgi:hypothetical protein
MRKLEVQSGRAERISVGAANEDLFYRPGTVRTTAALCKRSS